MKQFNELAFKINGDPECSKYSVTYMFSECKGVIVVPIYRDKIMLIKSYQPRSKTESWIFPYDVLEPYVPDNVSQKILFDGACQIMSDSLGIYNPDDLFLAGNIQFDNKEIPVIKYIIDNDQDFSTLNFNKNEVHGADLVSYNKLIELVKEGIIKDNFTLSAIPFI